MTFSRLLADLRNALHIVFFVAPMVVICGFVAMYSMSETVEQLRIGSFPESSEYSFLRLLHSSGENAPRVKNTAYATSQRNVVRELVRKVEDDPRLVLSHFAVETDDSEYDNHSVLVLGASSSPHGSFVDGFGLVYRLDSPDTVRIDRQSWLNSHNPEYMRFQDILSSVSCRCSQSELSSIADEFNSMLGGQEIILALDYSEISGPTVMSEQRGVLAAVFSDALIVVLALMASLAAYSRLIISQWSVLVIERRLGARVLNIVVRQQLLLTVLLSFPVFVSWAAANTFDNLVASNDSLEAFGLYVLAPLLVLAHLFSGTLVAHGLLRREAAGMS